MPIYEYRCASCGHQQEFLQKVSDAPLTICTQCGKTAFSKMVTAAGFQLKGSGWYATDFRNSGAKPAAKSESTKPEAKKSESAAESKSESSAPAADSKSSGSGSKPEGGASSSSDSGTKSAAPSCGRGGCLRC